MKKILCIGGLLLMSASASQAQVSFAQDFTMSDCNANMHTLFADYLDNNEVVIMEFFMTCGTCVTAGQTITAMMTGVDAQYPGMVNFWALAFTNSYSCPTVNNWVTSNSINAVPFDSGAAQVAYYGGFAMPTVVVVAGTNHQVLYNSNFDGPPGDTNAIHGAINSFFATLGMEGQNQNFPVSIYPNPAENVSNIEFTLDMPGMVNAELVDLTGKVVRIINGAEFPSGKNKLLIETADLPGGIYLLRIHANGRTTQQKLCVKQ